MHSRVARYAPTPNTGIRHAHTHTLAQKSVWSSATQDSLTCSTLYLSYTRSKWMLGLRTVNGTSTMWQRTQRKQQIPARFHSTILSSTAPTAQGWWSVSFSNWKDSPHRSHTFQMATKRRPAVKKRAGKGSTFWGLILSALIIFCTTSTKTQPFQLMIIRFHSLFYRFCDCEV